MSSFQLRPMALGHSVSTMDRRQYLKFGLIGNESSAMIGVSIS
jgi:hypothetical protein